MGVSVWEECDGNGVLLHDLSGHEDHTERENKQEAQA